MSSYTRRDQVLAAAVDVLAERGVRGLSHRRIDVRAEVPAGTTSNHFRSKQLLLAGVLSTATDMIASARADAVPRGADEHALAVGLTALLEHLSTAGEAAVLAWHRAALECAADPSTWEHVAASIAEAVDGWASSLTALPRRRRRLDAELLFGYVNGLVLLHSLQGAPDLSRERVAAPFAAELFRRRAPTRVVQAVDDQEVVPRSEPADRRARIADAAISVLADSGFRGFTHSTVDERAGLPRGSASNYFRTADALLDAAILDFVASSEARFFLELDRPPPTDPGALVDLMERRSRERFDREPWRTPALVLAMLEANAEPRLRTPVANAVNLWCNGYARWLSSSGSPDPVYDGQLLYAYGLGGTLIHYLWPRPDADPVAGIAPFLAGLLRERGSAP